MRNKAIALVDVFASLVVLGVFILFFPAVISESFLLALLTAVLLKVVLEMVTWAKTRVIAKFKSAQSTGAKVASIATLILVMPGSKFLVLELVALIFGDAVQLGGFFQVTALIIVLILARFGVRRLLDADEPTKG